jgi:hypothetical protein
MKPYVGVESYLSAFLTSVLDGGEWSASHSGPLPPMQETSALHWVGGWVGRRDTLDDVEKRKISCGYREFNSDSSIVQPLA